MGFKLNESVESTNEPVIELGSARLQMTFFQENFERVTSFMNNPIVDRGGGMGGKWIGPWVGSKQANLYMVRLG